MIKLTSEMKFKFKEWEGKFLMQQRTQTFINTFVRTYKIDTLMYTKMIQIYKNTSPWIYNKVSDKDLQIGHFDHAR